ncbi:hypothetical protein GGQ74_002607 [Desulfobaculum xiamenense]|uniref:N-acetyltransferase domain-containing protein n=1 Tax=Desulfobaculum xiamenense TaxID=995050 RepID=A0A846QRB4_9BACT|nr:GNAT family N-acetyltransferase [Desulfobaculum xiamenense]NJB68913.1 hypothetical protein [Desulfobaculum xiamenense]
MNRIIIRDVLISDLPDIVALNEHAVPAVNSVDEGFMRTSMDRAAYFRVVEQSAQPGRVAGFMIGYTPEASYESENFQWFKGHYPSFVYIDRIVIAPFAQRMGIGTALYDNISRFASETTGTVTCEVNIRPRNDDSLAFHAHCGFREVGTQETKGGTVAVSLLVKELAPASAAH